MTKLLIRFPNLQKIITAHTRKGSLLDNVRVSFLGAIPIGTFDTGKLDIIKKGRGNGQIRTKNNRARTKELFFLSLAECHFAGYPC